MIASMVLLHSTHHNQIDLYESILSMLVLTTIVFYSNYDENFPADSREIVFRGDDECSGFHQDLRESNGLHYLIFYLSALNFYTVAYLTDLTFSLR